MINLIPPKARTVAQKEYWVRILSVWGILIAIVAFIAALLLLPTYVLIQTQLSALEKEVVQKDTAGEQFRAAEELVREANITAEQLAEPSIRVLSSEIITEIVAATPPAVDPDTFRITRAGKSIDTIHIQGMAGSREALAAFRSALERSPLFESAAVPISDLARETNLPFAITVTMAQIRE